MYEWSVVTDSSCDLPEEQFDVQGGKVPFLLRVGEKTFLDDRKVSTAALLDAMEDEKGQSQTACPPPAAWLERFEEAQNVLAFTISSQLSGSYSSAVAARTLFLKQHPDRHVFVLDTKNAGPALAMLVLRAGQLIHEGVRFEKAAADLSAYAKRIHTAFALSSFQNLVKSGRIGRLSGYLAGKLGIWGIGIGTPQGKIEVRGMHRGVRHMLDGLLTEMRTNGFSKGEVCISHCQNAETAHALAERVRALWQHVRVTILPTGGLCSYYAERHGLIVSYCI